MPASVAVRTPVAGDVRARRRRRCPTPATRSPVIASTSSCWPLPSTPASATISPARTDSDSPSTAGSSRSSRTCRSSTCSRGSPGLRRPPCRRTAARRGRPRAGPGCARWRPRAGRCRSVLPRRSTVIRSATSSTSLSLWLMKTIAVPSALRRWITAHQLAHLLRGEHGGRLVEDEDAGAAVQRLQDLDALLGADGDVLDRRVGIDGESVAVRQLVHAGARGREVEQAARPARLLPEHDVLGHGHHRHEHEVLVHHPDPELDRVGRRVDRRPACRRRRSRLRSACRGRRGPTSASTCRRRSHRAAHGPRRHGRRSRLGRWRRPSRTSS